jgi:hypothetical protein
MCPGEWTFPGLRPSIYTCDVCERALRAGGGGVILIDLNISQLTLTSMPCRALCDVPDVMHMAG